MLNNSYWHYEQALTQHELNYLQAVAHSELQTSIPGIHLGETENKRESEIAWCTDPRTLQIATSLIYEANRNAGWWFDLNIPESAQITQYFPGGHYDTHSDGKTDHISKRRLTTEKLSPMPLDMTDQPEMVGLVRKLSLSINLTPQHEYEGGELQLEIGDETHSITGNAGSATIFPSWTNHRVCPITKGERRSLVMWMNGPPIR